MPVKFNLYFIQLITPLAKVQRNKWAMLFISFISGTTLTQNKYKYTYITTHFIYVTK